MNLHGNNNGCQATMLFLGTLKEAQRLAKNICGYSTSSPQPHARYAQSDRQLNALSRCVSVPPIQLRFAFTLILPYFGTSAGL